MNLPNKLTLLRVLMIPAFLAVLLAVPYPLGPVIAAAIYAVASATDALDGNLARKYNMVTDFGKFLDPLADKMLVISALVVLQHLKLIGPVPASAWIPATLPTCPRKRGQCSMKPVFRMPSSLLPTIWMSF